MLLKVYESINKYNEKIIEYKVYNNILYIIILDDEKFRLIKINLISRIEFYNNIINYYSDTSSTDNILIFNNNIYISDNTNVYRFYLHDTNNSINLISNLGEIKKLITILDKIYVVVKNNNNTYNLINIENNNIDYIIHFNSNDNYIDISGFFINIYTTAKEKHEIIFFDNYLIFLNSRTTKYIKFDMLDLTYMVKYMSNHFNYISNKYDINFLWKSDNSNIKNLYHDKLFYYITNNENNISIIHYYDFYKDSDKVLNIKYSDKLNIASFDFNDKLYFIVINNNIFKIYLNDDTNIIKNIQDNYENVYINIKNNIDEIKLPIKYIINRSEYVNEYVMNDIIQNNNVYDLEVNPDLNLTIYKNYVLYNELDNRNLYYLFEVCYHLKDIDLEYIAENIVDYIKNNNLSLEDAFNHMLILFYGNCLTQLDVLIYIVLNKYNREDFLTNINNFTDMDKYIINLLISNI